VENSFVALEGKSRGYYLAVAVLAVLTLAGCTCFGISYVAGHQVFGSSNVIPWGATHSPGHIPDRSEALVPSFSLL